MDPGEYFRVCLHTVTSLLGVFTGATGAIVGAHRAIMNKHTENFKSNRAVNMDF